MSCLGLGKGGKVLVSLVTLVAFFVSTFSYDLAWAAKAPSVPVNVGSENAPKPGSLRDLNPNTFTLPDNLGTIKYHWNAPSKPNTQYPTPNTTIIHIQDAHCNYAAQHKISEIIEYLNREYGVDTINLEGGAKEYDLSPFTGIKNSTVRDKVANYFVKEGLVSGAEYFAINNPEKVTLWGIEDTKLYIDNLNVYRESLKHKEEFDKHLKNLSYILSDLKTKIYSKELLDFDLKYSAYKAGNSEFKDYVNGLIQIAHEKAMDIKAHTNIYLLNQTLAAEAGIDFKKANSERDDLIDKLQKGLSRNGLEELVLKTVEFKSERLPHSDFYAYLSAQAKEVDIDINDFQELKKYVAYISAYNTIDKAKVTEEMEKLEVSVKDALCRNDKERELWLLSKNLAILKNIFNISLTREDYKYYLDNEEAFNVSNYASFINKEAPLYKITARLDKDITNLDRYREDISRFYEYSFKRDDAFMKNIRFHGPSTMEEAGKEPSPKGTVPKVTIVITGGFHTENLCESFRKENVSYISIMPNFKNENGSESPYFRLLAGRPNPVESKIYALFSSTLAIPSLFNQISTLAYDKRQLAALNFYVYWVTSGKKALLLKHGENILGAIDPEGNVYIYDKDKLPGKESGINFETVFAIQFTPSLQRSVSEKTITPPAAAPAGAAREADISIRKSLQEGRVRNIVGRLVEAGIKNNDEYCRMFNEGKETGDGLGSIVKPSEIIIDESIDADYIKVDANKEARPLVVQLQFAETLSDDELAVVIGHELTHLQEFATGRIKEWEAILRPVSSETKFSLAIGIILGPFLSKIIFSVITFFKCSVEKQLFLASLYSQKREVLADKMGIFLMAHANYNPEAAVAAFKKTLKFGRKKPKKGIMRKLIDMLTPTPQVPTHPSDELRMKGLEKVAKYFQYLYAPEGKEKDVLAAPAAAPKELIEKARSISQPAMKRWKSLYAGRNEWNAPTDVTKAHYESGIVDRDLKPNLYSKMEDILLRVWEQTGRKEEAPLLFLIETDLPDACISKENNVFISLGLLRMIAKARQGAITDEDIAFVIAHELGHYLQKKDGVDLESRTVRIAMEHDADDQAQVLMNKAGYTTAGIPEFFGFLKNFSNGKEKGNKHKISRDIERLDLLSRLFNEKNIAAALETDEFAIIVRDRLFRSVLRAAIQEGERRHMYPPQVFENLSHGEAMSREEFKSALKGVNTEEKKRLISICLIYREDRERALVDEEPAKIPILHSHPFEDSRIIRVGEYKNGTYLGSFNNPPHSFSGILIEELQSPAPTILDMAAIDRFDIDTVKERVRDLRKGPLDIVFFLARIDSSDLKPNRELYKYVMEEALRRIPDDTEREVFQFQINILFGMADRNKELPITSDFGRLVKSMPLFSGKLTQQYLDDEYYGYDTSAVNGFIDKYSKEVMTLTQKLFESADKGSSLEMLIDKYVLVVDSESSYPDRYLKMIAKSIRTLAGKPMDDALIIKIFKMGEKAGQMQDISAPFNDWLYEQLKTNSKLLDIIKESGVKEVRTRGIGAIGRISKTLATTDLAALGQNMEDVIKSVYFLVVEKTDRDTDTAVSEFCMKWIDVLHRRARNQGIDTIEFIPIMIKFLEDRDTERSQYSRVIHDILFQRLKEEEGVLVREEPKPVPGLKDYQTWRDEKATVKVRWRDSTTGEVKYNGGEILSITKEESYPVIWLGVNGISLANIQDAVPTGEIVPGLGAQGVEPAETPVDIKIEEHLRQVLFSGHEEALAGLSIKVKRLLFLFSHGVLISIDDLINAHLENMRIDEAKTLYNALKDRFTPEFLERKKMDIIDTDSFTGLQLRVAVTYPKKFREYLTRIYTYLVNRGRHGKDWRSRLAETGRHFPDEIPSNTKISRIIESYCALEPPVMRTNMPVRGLISLMPDNTSFPDDVLTSGNQIFPGRMDPGVFKTYEAYLFPSTAQKMSWEDIVGAVSLQVPAGIFRNYLLYYLFFNRELKPAITGLKDEDFMNFDRLKDGIQALDPTTRLSVMKKFSLITSKLVRDEYIEVLNKNRMEAYKVSKDTDDFNRLTLPQDGRGALRRWDPDSRQWKSVWDETSFYDAFAGSFEDSRYSEAGTRRNQIDLMLAEMFRPYLEAIVKEGVDAGKVMDEIEAIYPRESNTRDYYLEIVYERVKSGAIEMAGLEQLERLGKMTHSVERAQRVKLLALQRKVEERIAKNGSISFEEELEMIVGKRDASGELEKDKDGKPLDEGYFPKMDEFRDDILRSLEWNRVSTESELEEIRRYLTFDFKTQTRKEVADREAKKDNIIVAMRSLKVEEKQKLLLWLAGLSDEKPTCIKKLEILSFSNLDALREGKVVSTDRYRDVGISARIEFLKRLLFGDEESIIHMDAGKNRMRHGAAKFTGSFFDALMRKYDLPKDSTNKVIAIIESVLNNFDDAPGKQLDILTNVILEFDKISKDANFKDYSADKKLGRLAKTFLEATGLIGIKIGQYLAISSNFDLPQDFRKELIDLSELERGMDKGMILSVLNELGLEKSVVDRVLKAASVKTVLLLRNEPSSVTKVKNLSVYYNITQDLKRMENVLLDLEKKGIISPDQREDLLEEMKYIVKTETDFGLEKRNLERAREVRAKRSDPHWLFKMMEGALSTEGIQPKMYTVDYTERMDVISDMIIKESKVEGVSLKMIMEGKSEGFTAEELKGIKRMVALEAIRQIFEDGAFHADLHPGNIMVHKKDGIIHITIIDWGLVIFPGIPSGLEKAMADKLISKEMRPVFERAYEFADGRYTLKSLKDINESDLQELLRLFKEMGPPDSQKTIERLFVLKTINTLSKRFGMSGELLPSREVILNGLKLLGVDISGKAREILDEVMTAIKSRKSLKDLIQAEIGKLDLSTQRSLDKIGYLFGEEVPEVVTAKAALAAKQDLLAVAEKTVVPEKAGGREYVLAVEKEKIKHFINIARQLIDLAGNEQTKGWLNTFLPGVAFDTLTEQVNKLLSPLSDAIDGIDRDKVRIVLDEDENTVFEALLSLGPDLGTMVDSLRNMGKEGLGGMLSGGLGAILTGGVAAFMRSAALLKLGMFKDQGKRDALLRLIGKIYRGIISPVTEEPAAPAAAPKAPRGGRWPWLRSWLMGRGLEGKALDGWGVFIEQILWSIASAVSVLGVPWITGLVAVVATILFIGLHYVGPESDRAPPFRDIAIVSAINLAAIFIIASFPVLGILILTSVGASISHYIYNRPEDPIVKLTPSTDYGVGITTGWWRIYRGNNRLQELIKKGLHAQGWKLHIAATEENVDKILDLVLPILKDHKVDHKVINGIEKLKKQNRNGVQIGKIITIYTESPEQAYELALELDSKLSDKDYKPPKGLTWNEIGSEGDKLFGNSRLIAYRYGSFTDPYVFIDGKWDKDKRSKYKPDSIPDLPAVAPRPELVEGPKVTPLDLQKVNARVIAGKEGETMILDLGSKQKAPAPAAAPKAPRGGRWPWLRSWLMGRGLEGKALDGWGVFIEQILWSIASAVSVLGVPWITGLVAVVATILFIGLHYVSPESDRAPPFRDIAIVGAINLAAIIITAFFPALGILTFLGASISHYIYNRLVSQDAQAEGKQLTLTERLAKEGEVPIGELMALQINLNRRMSLSDRFTERLINNLKIILANYCNHNIANFISRQFAEQERGIVELISNGLDASKEKVQVRLGPGEGIVANGDKGIELEDIFTCLLIPTYSTKLLGDEKIGRFGVGFLSSLDYLNNDSDAMEIVSFNNGVGYRIKFGVHVIREEGRPVEKIVVLKSIEENITLTVEEKERIFPGIAQEGALSGTSIRIISHSLNEKEISTIESTVKERFNHWLGQPIVLTTQNAGVTNVVEIGLKKTLYKQAYAESDGKQGKRFTVLFRRESEDTPRLALADEAGSGKLIITLQGVMLREISVPGSNVVKQLVVNLPASTQIPTSRDRVMITDDTVKGILETARQISMNPDLTLNEKISILNSLYYLLDWAGTTNPSLVAGKAEQFEDIVTSLIMDEQKKMKDSPETVIFAPDMLQAREFFDGTDNIILVNPKLLDKIGYAGKTPRQLLGEEYNFSGQQLDIYIVPINGERPAVRLGKTVFVKEAKGSDYTDVVWQHILAATVINFWDCMMTRLDLKDARFESAGQYNVVKDVETVRKGVVLEYIRGRIREINKEIEKIVEIKEEKRLKEARHSLDIYNRLLALAERAKTAGGLFFILQDEINKRKSSLMGVVLDSSHYFGDINMESLKEYVAMRRFDFHNYDFFAMPKVEQPQRQEEAPNDVFRANLILQIMDALEKPRGEARAVDLKEEGLTTNDRNLLFTVDIIAQWMERGGDDHRRLIEELLGGEKRAGDIQRLFQLIANYRMSCGDARTIDDSKVGKLLDYLDSYFIRQGLSSQPTGPIEARLEKKERPVLTGRLADIVSSFFRLGRDIRSAEEVAEEKEEGSNLRLSVAQGQIQHSINYQDPEEFVFMRELIQNARDAILEQESRGEKIPAERRKIDLEVRLVHADGKTKAEVVVSDPVGMDLSTLLNFLCIPNRSKKKAEFLTGFFGHGFFTTLKESDEVRVRTSTGDGRVIALILRPVSDEEEGVITDVTYELYEDSANMQGTEVVWRKRGEASVIDDGLLRVKAEMFSRTMKEDIPAVLDGTRVIPIDRSKARLSEFRTPAGQTCAVYFDPGRPSIVMQKGLFVTRFDRHFIEGVLGIPATSDLFNILMRLADAGVAVELPEVVGLTRDRGHFIKKDFTSDIRNIISAAIFDAAIRALLAGRIALPYNFSYDFLTDVSPEELYEPGRKSAVYDMLAKYYIKGYRKDIGGVNFKFLLARLEDSQDKLLNVAKNWYIHGDISLQKLLGDLKQAVDKLQKKVMSSFKEFFYLREFDVFINAAISRPITPQDEEAFKAALYDAIYKLSGEAIPSNTEKGLDTLFEKLRNSELNNRSEVVVSELRSILDECALIVYKNLVNKEISLAVKGKLGASREVGADYSETIIKDVWKAKPAPQAANPVTPVIEDDIIQNLSSKFIVAKRISFDDDWQAMGRAVQKQKETGEALDLRTAIGKSHEEVGSLLATVTMDKVSQNKSQLPHLYFFLRATHIMMSNLRWARENGDGAVYPGNIEVGMYYDPEDMGVLARGGFGGIEWNMGTCLDVTRSLMNYIKNPDDNNFNKFLALMIEVISHEMTHVEEDKLGIRREKGTHNKAFFDRQIKPLGAALQSPQFKENLKQRLRDLADEYRGDFSEDSIVDEFMKKDDAAAIAFIGRVIIGRAPPAVPGAGARKNIFGQNRVLKDAERKELLKMAQGVTNPVSIEMPDGTKESINIREISFDENDSIGTFLAGKGITGPYNLYDKATNTVFIFIPNKIGDRVIAIEHERFEAACRLYLENNPLSPKLSSQLSEGGKYNPIERASHILAWAMQINKHQWKNVEGNDNVFLQGQLAGMSREQLRDIINENRELHNRLITEVLDKDIAEKVDAFNRSVQARALGEIAKLDLPEAPAPAAAPAPVSMPQVKASPETSGDVLRQMQYLGYQIQQSPLRAIGKDQIVSFATEFRDLVVRMYAGPADSLDGKAVAVWKTLDLSNDKELVKFLLGTSVREIMDQTAIPLLMAYLYKADQQEDDRIISFFEALISSRQNRLEFGDISLEDIGLKDQHLVKGSYEVMIQRSKQMRLEDEIAKFFSSPIKLGKFNWIDLLGAKRSQKRIQLLEALLADSEKDKSSREYTTVDWDERLVEKIEEVLAKLKVPVAGIKYLSTELSATRGGAGITLDDYREWKDKGVIVEILYYRDFDRKWHTHAGKITEISAEAGTYTYIKMENLYYRIPLNDIGIAIRQDMPPSNLLLQKELPSKLKEYQDLQAKGVVVEIRWVDKMTGDLESNIGRIKNITNVETGYPIIWLSDADAKGTPASPKMEGGIYLRDIIKVSAVFPEDTVLRAPFAAPQAEVKTPAAAPEAPAPAAAPAAPKTDIGSFVKNEGMPALRLIEKLANENRLILLGEGHHGSQSKNRLLPEIFEVLHNRGYTHLLIEVDSIYQDMVDKGDFEAISKTWMGFLNPSIGDLVKSAQNNELQVIAADYQGEYRETLEEKDKYIHLRFLHRIEEILDKNPNAKIAVLIGAGHLLKNRQGSLYQLVKNQFVDATSVLFDREDDNLTIQGQVSEPIGVKVEGILKDLKNSNVIPTSYVEWADHVIIFPKAFAPAAAPVAPAAAVKPPAVPATLTDAQIIRDIFSKELGIKVEKVIVRNNGKRYVTYNGGMKLMIPANVTLDEIVTVARKIAEKLRNYMLAKERKAKPAPRVRTIIRVFEGKVEVTALDAFGRPFGEPIILRDGEEATIESGITYAATRLKYPRDYAPGLYRTTVSVIEGKVYGFSYDEKGALGPIFIMTNKQPPMTFKGRIEAPAPKAMGIDEFLERNSELKTEKMMKLVEKLKEAMSKGEDGMRKAFEYNGGVYEAAKPVIDKARFPEEGKFIFMPVSKLLCGIIPSVLQGQMQKLWRIERGRLYNEYRFGNITVVFYDGTIEDLQKKVDGKKKYGLNDKNTVIYMDGNSNNMDKILKIRAQMGENPPVFVRDVAPEGGGYLSIGGHIVLAIGLLDLVKNRRPGDDYWRDVLKLLKALSSADADEYKDITTREKFIEKIENAELKIQLPPVSKKELDENMRDFLLTEEATMQSL